MGVWSRPSRRFLAWAVAAAAVATGAFAVHPLRATWHLAEGRNALLARDTETALSHLNAALQTGYHQAEAQFLLARACRRRGEFRVAQEHLRKAKSLGYPSRSLQREEWLILAQSGQLKEVEKHLSDLLRDPQGDAPAICEAFVEGYFATYQFPQGLAILEAWQKDFPDDPQPHAFLGVYRAHLEDWQSAAEHFQRALDRAPGRSDLRGRLAEVLVELRQYEDAVKQYQRALERSPTNVQLLIGLGKCAQVLGKSEEALDLFQRAVRQEPDNLEARLALARVALAEGRADAALEQLRRVCDKQPWNSEARYVLGQALQKTGNTDEARSHFEFAAAAQVGLTEIHRRTEELRANPGDYESRYRIGWLLLQYKDPVQGVAWLRSVLEFHPGHVPTHNTLAEHYSRTGQSALALRHRKLAGVPVAGVP